MDTQQDIQNATLFYSGLLRDGGSAVMILNTPTCKMKLRVMRSIAERQTELFDCIEVSIDDQIKGHVKSLGDIFGLGPFIEKYSKKLDPRVFDAFMSLRD